MRNAGLPGLYRMHYRESVSYQSSAMEGRASARPNPNLSPATDNAIDSWRQRINGKSRRNFLLLVLSEAVLVLDLKNTDIRRDVLRNVHPLLSKRRVGEDLSLSFSYSNSEKIYPMIQ